MGFKDLNNDELSLVLVTKLPSHGSLKISGSLVTIGQNIMVSDLRNLEFVP